MSNKDTKAKEYLSSNERFADICNFYIYDGEEVIHPENLIEQDTTELLSVYGFGREELQKQKARDLLKSCVLKSSDGILFMLIGIENQSDVHYAMPVKNMIYDALNYGDQVAEATRKHKKAHDYGTKAEFLSGFKKSDYLTPVITLTVYFGADEWDGPLMLSDMFRRENRPVANKGLY